MEGRIAFSAVYTTNFPGDELWERAPSYRFVNSTDQGGMPLEGVTSVLHGMSGVYMSGRIWRILFR